MYSGLYKKFLVLLFIAAASVSSAQQFHFSNYSVDEGLIQSQVTAITQDRSGRLWVGTEGGISAFDGKRFTQFAEKKGLPGNWIKSLTCNSDGRIWCVTAKGFAYYTNSNFRAYRFTEHVKGSDVQQIIADRRGRIIILAGYKLYEVLNDSLVRIPAGNEADATVTAIAAGSGDILWAAATDKNIDVHTDTGWRRIPYPVASNKKIFVYHLYLAKQEVVIATNAGLFRYTKNKWVRVDLPQDISSLQVVCAVKDAQGRLWLGLTSGAICIGTDSKQTYFNTSNGYSNSRTSAIYLDAQNNLWLGTDGEGLFRYDPGSFVQYGEKDGLAAPIITSIVETGNGVWLGTYGGGMVSLQDGKISHPFFLPVEGGVRKITCSVVDKKGMLWIGTLGHGIWKYDGKSCQKVTRSADNRNIIVGELFIDKNERLWVATSEGFGYMKEDQLQMVNTSGIVWGFAQAGEKVLLSTDEGLFFADSDGQVSIASKNKQVTHSQVINLTRDNRGLYWLQTNGNGVLVWDGSSDSVLKQIGAGEGLPSDVVYSAKQDAGGRMWLGTGLGLCYIKLENDLSFQIQTYGKAKGLSGMEANKNAMLITAEGTIYYGTTKGLFVYHTQADKLIPQTVGEVFFESVKLFGVALPNTTGSLYGNKTPQTLSLSPNENHLSFEFSAVSISGLDAVDYQYQLEGIETQWSAPSANTSVTYSSLPPGRYIFKVRGRKAQGDWSAPAVFAFSIQTPFYKTAFFQLLLVAGLILTGVIIHFISTKKRSRRKAQIEKLKQEEQDKVRKKTAEDFHDEMGNRLTRIALLTDIVLSKLKGKDTDTIQLARQIKQNAQQLYRGANDIIWSLKPASDHLYEIVQRLQDFGAELFQDTGIHFSSSAAPEELDSVRLPPDYSRNIIMIINEALHNALKHSGGSSVMLYCLLSEGWIIFTVNDNGKGFQTTKIKKGHGIDNMKSRAVRISAVLAIESFPGSGTELRLMFKLNKHP